MTKPFLNRLEIAVLMGVLLTTFLGWNKIYNEIKKGDTMKIFE
jgi:hypothetical protein